MGLSGKVKRLRIYIGEEAYCDKKPLYRAILEKARRLDIAGATVFKGIQSYGASTRLIRASRFLELSSDLPIIIEIIDTPDKLMRLGPFLRDNLTKGLVTVEDVDVIAYSADFSEFFLSGEKKD